MDYPDCKWKGWKDYLDKTEQTIPLESAYHSILVDTAETLRATIVMKIAVSNNYPFLIIGHTGTGTFK